MNSKSFKRISRAAAILTAPVAAAVMISSAPANAADAGELEVTTTIEYDYVIIETEDGFTAGVEGDIPLFPADDATATAYATYEQDTWAVGIEQELTGDEPSTTVWGEVYPTDELTLGIESNLTEGETTVYADYETDNFGIGGEYNLTTGEASVYGEIYPTENTTVGIELNSDGSSNLYGSVETPLSEENPEVTLVTEFEYGLTDAAEADADA